MRCFDPAGSHGEDRWFAVWSIALGSFALVFSELIPVGLLARISSYFAVSIGLAATGVTTLDGDGRMIVEGGVRWRVRPI
jgi:hypothetical protein